MNYHNFFRFNLSLSIIILQICDCCVHIADFGDISQNSFIFSGIPHTTKRTIYDKVFVCLSKAFEC